MDYNLQKNQNAEQTYHYIRNSIVSAQHRLSTAVNSAMVTTYQEIGEQIFKACGENDRAEYGKKLLEYLSEQLTAEFGKGFDKSNLRKMRQFYCTFPIRDTLCPELSWSHYRVLMRINDEQARRFYMEECAKAAWSVRQLERQINTMYYQRILASQDKIAVANEIQTTEPKPEYEKIVKDPYVMEFLQIQPDTHVYEVWQRKIGIFTVYIGQQKLWDLCILRFFYLMPEVRKCSARYCFGVFPVFSRNTDVK